MKKPLKPFNFMSTFFIVFMFASVIRAGDGPNGTFPDPAVKVLADLKTDLAIKIKTLNAEELKNQIARYEGVRETQDVLDLSQLTPQRASAIIGKIQSPDLSTLKLSSFNDLRFFYYNRKAQRIYPHALFFVRYADASIEKMKFEEIQEVERKMVQELLHLWGFRDGSPEGHPVGAIQISKEIMASIFSMYLHLTFKQDKEANECATATQYGHSICVDPRKFEFSRHIGQDEDPHFTRTGPWDTNGYRFAMIKRNGMHEGLWDGSRGLTIDKPEAQAWLTRTQFMETQVGPVIQATVQKALRLNHYLIFDRPTLGDLNQMATYQITCNGGECQIPQDYYKLLHRFLRVTDVTVE
jgi:hypothetical protein